MSILTDGGSGVIAFGINSGAYIAEIVRGGILSIDQGQTEGRQVAGTNAAPNNDLHNNTSGGQKYTSCAGK